MRARTLDKILDNTLSFGPNSLLFLTKSCGRYHLYFLLKWFLPRHAICQREGEAAKTFYDGGGFAHAEVAPLRLEKSLFDWSELQGMDNVSQQDVWIGPSEQHSDTQQWFLIRNVRLPSTGGRA
jgi:hypothetical protein